MTNQKHIEWKYILKNLRIVIIVRERGGEEFNYYPKTNRPTPLSNNKKAIHLL
jgi:hypothetical protein